MKKLLVCLIFAATFSSAYGFWPFDRWTKKKAVQMPDEIVNLVTETKNEVK